MPQEQPADRTLLGSILRYWGCFPFPSDKQASLGKAEVLCSPSFWFRGVALRVAAQETHSKEHQDKHDDSREERITRYSSSTNTLKEKYQTKSSKELILEKRDLTEKTFK